MKLGYKHTIYASYIGYITQAIVNNFAPLLFITFRNSFGIPLSKITLLITLNFFIQLLVDLISARLVDKIGYRRCVAAAHIFSSLGLVLMAILPFAFKSAFAGLVICVVFYAVGGGLIEVLISPIVEACPTDNKAAAMSLLHSFYCWGTVGVVLLSTVFLYAFGRESWRLLAVFWAVIPALNTVLFCRVPINTLTQNGEGMTSKQLFKSKAFWLFIILMIAAGASEQAMSQWASAFAESGLHISKTAGDLAGPCAFSLLMGSARVISARFSKKADITLLMIISGVLCVAAYMLAAFSKNAVFSLLGCALCGFSVGVFWPGAFSMASKSFSKGGTALFAFLALAGDVGCMSGPTLVGETAGLFGDSLKSGIAFAAVFPVILICSCFALKRNTNC